MGSGGAVRRRWLLATVRGTGGRANCGLANICRACPRKRPVAHPAYEYQRASYQYYNVSYAENMRLIDPFKPELGPLTARAMATRLATNLPRVLLSLGESIKVRERDLAQCFARSQKKLFHRTVIPGDVMSVPILGLSALVLAGIIMLARRGSWLMVFIFLVSMGLVLTTPWPAQFTRYWYRSDRSCPFQQF